ncbi:Ion channel [Nesidiocoris tenuis]|uniref:Ion channel n=1 Tax=Nesidiocoris tenuis TaxID=355587 RepID=A0ABN7AUU2_9HEMI|nr:Ion channel [Nesidiocoris tenuis]
MRDLSALVNDNQRLNVLYQRNWTKLVTEQLRQLEADVVHAVRRDSLVETDHQWSFAGSLLYSLTIITTIGCGRLGPRTVEGKLATMVYALIGVPLMLACLTHLGGQLAELIHSFYFHICSCPHKRSPSNDRMEYQLEDRSCKMRSVEVVGGGCGRAVCRLTSLDSILDYPPRGATADSDEDDTDLCRGPALDGTPSRMPLIWRGGGSCEMPRPGTPPPPRLPHPSNGYSPGYSQPGPRRPPVPLLVAVLLIVGYLCLGAWLFTWSSERLSYLEGLYFTFTALTTIGLSDLVPTITASAATARSSRRAAADSQVQLLAVCLYILCGLTLVATAFALVQEQVVSKTRQIAISLGVVKRGEELPV